MSRSIKLAELEPESLAQFGPELPHNKNPFTFLDEGVFSPC
jgi:hypothetical protein